VTSDEARAPRPGAGLPLEAAPTGPRPAGGAPRRRPLPRRLTFRLAVALSLGAGAILLGAAAWNLELQRRHLTRLVEVQASELVEVVRGSTRQAMLENNAAELQRMIDTIAAQADIDRIRVFDKLGRITHSSEPGEVGRLVDRTAEQCVACHAADRPLTRLDVPRRSRVFERPGGGRVLGLIAPILNEASCATACHAHRPDQTILGVLDVQLPMGPVEQSLAASERQLAVGLAGTVLAVLLLTGGLAWRMVLRPVGRLTEAARRLAGGDFTARVPVESADEVGDLARSWNAMAAELGRAHHDLAEWGRTLEARVRDKTRELERTHQQMVRVEKMASLGKLSASVAHELNNPLAGIATYAKLLQRRLVEAREADPALAAAGASGGSARGGPELDGPDTVRILKLIEGEAMRCGSIVRNLLLFSRAPGARFASEDLAPIVERCALLVRHPFALQGVDLRSELEAGLPRIECDGALVQQMLLALVINALEATPAGGAVTVSARHEPQDGAIRLAVADTGHGIAPELLDRVFEPFFTTKAQASGVGLGLPVVYGIVERHRGTIHVSSAPGAGTTFTVHLPLRQEGAERAGGAG
jgi:two-component system NtrC family sensor kinase